MFGHGRRTSVSQTQTPIVVRGEIRKLNLTDIVGLNLTVPYVRPDTCPRIEPFRVVEAHHSRAAHKALRAALLEVTKIDCLIRGADRKGPTLVPFDNVGFVRYDKVLVGDQ